MSVVLDGGPLALADVAAVARERALVAVGPAAGQRVAEARRFVEEVAGAAEPIYGITTGVGKLKDVVIPREQRDELQRNLVLSHAGGVGAALGEAETRAVMLLLAASLARGASGVRREVLDLVVGCLNAGVHPVVPEQGSVGSSGDLAPLAHVALCLIGEGEAWRNGAPAAAGDALAHAGLRPVRLQAKEGLALLNGTHLMAGLGTLAVLDAARLAALADVTGAMSLEALKGTVHAFDERVVGARPQPGQLACGAFLRLLLADSEIAESHRDCGKVQDPYSLRCMPQVHGASRDALDFARAVLEREAASTTDNPLVFVDPSLPHGGEILSGGNFHGQPVAIALDTAAIAVAELANISERRIEQLVNPHLSSGLPPFLAPDSGLNSGFMIAQVTAAALVSENKVLCHPASVDSIPSSAGREDHVSMGATAALKLAQVVSHVRDVLAIELLAAAQGLDLRSPLTPARVLQSAHACVRRSVGPMMTDRPIYQDIRAARALIDDGSLLAAVGEYR